MEKKVSKIGILTSGGDAPGMNAAIRAVVRTGIFHGMELYGILRGYQGMIDDDIIPMDSRSVANIIQRGGTILKTARCKEFFEYEGRKKAYENLKRRDIDGLVIIGGDGSFRGAVQFSGEFDIPCIGLAGTIDKDIYGTDFTIGFDTAVNTAVEAIDKVRDTMDAHDRIFIIEVMGRDAGYIALHSGIATGAENILIPERKTKIDDVVASLMEKERRKKLVNLIVVAEGDDFGGANKVQAILKEKLPNAEIKAEKGKLDFYLNGENVVSTMMWDENWKKMIAGSKFKSMPAFGTYTKGKIGLQDHGNMVWYRNVMIKKL